jgi:hypothetical protein
MGLSTEVIETNPIKFKGELTNDDAPELSEEQKSFLLVIIEKSAEGINGRFVEGLIDANYLPDNSDTQAVMDFLDEVGFEVELKEM